MGRRNNALTYILALIPGVGYMYLGLMIKGIEFLCIYYLIEPVLDLIGFGFLAHIIKIILWFYIFIDTIHVAKRMDNGEQIRDEDFIFKKFGKDITNVNYSYNMGTKSWIIVGWILVIIGIMAIFNKLFNTTEMYTIIRFYLSAYFIPIVLVIAGVFILIRNK